MDAIHPRLLAWFDAHKRELPWRGVGDPYAVWISEVMLQQTRAGTVVPYYRRWMRRFPDVDALADADLEEVLRVWRGLGYYARARNAHRCARRVRDEWGGVFPRSAAELGTLPGIGPYTAAAVASIAFGEAVPAVDGNVRRVVARLFDLPDPSPAKARDLAGSLMDTARPGDFNEAMMELGATVCTPRSPSCGACPVAAGCRALAAGTVAERPARRTRRAGPTRTWDVRVAVSPRGRTLVVRRPPDGLLGGMWEFPAVEVDGGGGAGERRGGWGGAWAAGGRETPPAGREKPGTAGGAGPHDPCGWPRPPRGRWWNCRRSRTASRTSRRCIGPAGSRWRGSGGRGRRAAGSLRPSWPTCPCRSRSSASPGQRGSDEHPAGGSTRWAASPIEGEPGGVEPDG